MVRRTSIIALILLSACAANAVAGGTSVWELSSKEHFDKGTLKGVVSFAPGGLRLGLGLSSLSVEEVGVWRAYVSPAGDLFVGTAKNASVYKLENGKLKRILKTDELAVTDLILDPEGNLYVATIPHGKIFRIPVNGEKAVYQLPDPYPWRILFGPQGNLYVASGPKGKVYLMEKGGGWTREVFSSDREKNIISMALLPGGALLCGSAEHGILYRIEPDGKVAAVHNFPEKEIRDIAVYGDGIYVATNISQKSFKQTAFVSELAAVLQSEAQGSAPAGSRKRFKKLLNGKVYHIDKAGRVDQVLALAKNYILDLGVTRDGSVLAATGVGGRVFSVDRQGTHFTTIDLDENQVITLAMQNGKLLAVGTGHPGKLYRVDQSPSEKGIFLSEILDTGFPSTFGRFFRDGRGAVEVQTRTGNTAKPDETWSDWSTPFGAVSAPIQSPKARFFQFRIHFGRDPGAVVTHVRVHFTRANQRPVVRKVTVGTAPSKQTYRVGSEKILPKVPIKIQASDPDGDAMVFRVFFRRAGKGRWIALNKKPLLKPEFQWVVTAMPDGLYEVKVEASDELANPPGEALRASKVSAPFVIDNRRPRVEALSVFLRGREVVLQGRAEDEASHITHIAYSVDDGPWFAVYPADLVFDSLREDFLAVLLPMDSGLHRITVRVKDRSGNVGVAEIEFDNK